MEHLDRHPVPKKGSPQHTTLLMACRGSGKTTWLCQYLDQTHGLYQSVYYLSPSVDHDPKTSASLSRYVKINYRDGPARHREPPVIRIFSRPDQWDEIVTALSQRNAEQSRHRSLLVMDDVGWYSKWLRSSQGLQALFFNARHVKVDIIMALQHWKSVMPGIRANATRLLLWASPNRTQVKLMAEEFPIRDQSGKMLSSHEWLSRYDKITSKRYQFMVLAS